VTYPITMVGKDPRTGGTSTIHTVIIALKMNFVAGHQDTSALTNLGFAGFTAPPLNHTFDGDRRVSSLLNSPIFTNNTYPRDRRLERPVERHVHALAIHQRRRLELPRHSDE